MMRYRRFNPDNVMVRGEVDARFGVELGPCPFCLTLNVGLFMGPNPHVTCMSCGADGPLTSLSPYDAGVLSQVCHLWNSRRALPDQYERKD